MYFYYSISLASIIVILFCFAIFKHSSLIFLLNPHVTRNAYSQSRFNSDLMMFLTSTKFWILDTVLTKLVHSNTTTRIRGGWAFGVIWTGSQFLHQIRCEPASTKLFQTLAKTGPNFRHCGRIFPKLIVYFFLHVWHFRLNSLKLDIRLFILFVKLTI